MARSYRRVDREQPFLLPPDMRDWLPKGHLAWFVLEVVGELDTSALHARHPKSGPGRQAYDPDMLLAVLLYAYAVGQRSSRAIERLCATDVAFRVLCGQDAPDHTRLARFRKEHEAVFADLFTQVLLMCARAGMGRVGVVAIDGTKIAANAGLGANRGEASLRRQLAALEEAARETADRIVAEADAVDEAETNRFGAAARGDELAPKFADPAGRADAIRRALQEIEDQREAEAAQSAQDAAEAEEYLRAVEAGNPPMGRAPAGVDPVRLEQARLALAEQRAADMSTDRFKRSNARRKARLARERLAALADGDTPDGSGESAAADRGDETKTHQANVTDPDSRVMKTRNGWVQGYNAQLAVSDDHLILALALTQDPTDPRSFGPLITAAVAAVDRVQSCQPCSPAAGIGIVLADAGYFSEENLTMAGPDRLIACGTRRDMEREATANPASGPAPKESTAKDAMRHRLRTVEAAQTYKRRGATVEPVNAHLKDRVGLRRFSRRGLAAATSELNLAAAVVNLLKLHRRTLAIA
jgi:transposase